MLINIFKYLVNHYFHKQAKTVQVPIHEVSEKGPVNEYLPHFKISACLTSLPLAIFNIDIIISILYMSLVPQQFF